MKQQTSDFDKHLIRTMKDYGYECTVLETSVRLRQLPLLGYPGFTVPWAFKSVFQAAEHLIPVIRDDNYRESVHATEL